MSEIKTILSATEDHKAKYDETVKELLSNKQFLSRIVKRFVPEFSSYSLDDIEHRYIEANSISVSKVGVERNRTNLDGISNEHTTLNEGTIYYDIIFRIVYPTENNTYIGMYINIEAQNAYYPGYPLEMRAIYYAARKFASQLKQINKTTNYGCLEKVYSIWICMGDVPNYEANTATLYYTEKKDIIGYVQRSVDEYDLIDVVILRINDKITATDDVLRLLQILCSNIINKTQKLTLLEQYGIRMDDEVREGVNRMCNLSDLVETRGEARGEARGRAIEKLVTQKAIVFEMLRDKMPYKKIIQYSNVSLEQIRQWEQELYSHEN